MEQAEKPMFWAGCNYYVNSGLSEHEPIGTAQSMHDCEGCDKLPFCTIKKDTETWEFNEEIKKDMNKKMEEMNSIIREQSRTSL